MKTVLAFATSIILVGAAAFVVGRESAAHSKGSAPVQVETIHERVIVQGVPAAGPQGVDPALLRDEVRKAVREANREAQEHEDAPATEASHAADTKGEEIMRDVRARKRISAKDSTALHATLGEMTAETREAILSEIAVAVNRGEIRFDTDAPLL